MTRDEAIYVLEKNYPDSRYESLREAVDVAIGVLEQKKGKWHKNDNGTWTCSFCQSWIPNEQHYYARYCLYCGAEMETIEALEQTEQKKGKWLMNSGIGTICSNCFFRVETTGLLSYCPHCGAKMEGIL